MGMFIEVELSDGTCIRWSVSEDHADELLAAITNVIGEPDTIQL